MRFLLDTKRVQRILAKLPGHVKNLVDATSQLSNAVRKKKNSEIHDKTSLAAWNVNLRVQHPPCFKRFALLKNGRSLGHLAFRRGSTSGCCHTFLLPLSKNSSKRFPQRQELSTRARQRQARQTQVQPQDPSTINGNLSLRIREQSEQEPPRP